MTVDSTTAGRYVRAAINSELQGLRAATSGRACAAFKAAAALGSLVGAGSINQAEAEALLLDAAEKTGLPLHEARTQIRRGLLCGLKTPRDLPAHPTPGRPNQCPTAVPIHDEDVPKRPPQNDVVELWESCRPLSSDNGVVAMIQRRFGTAWESILDLSETWDLARVIPLAFPLKRWAWSSGGSWSNTGHRLVFLLRDHNGIAVSVRARCIHPDIQPKTLAPAGFEARGAIISDPLGVQVLSGSLPDWWDPKEIVICEGELDWLSWAGLQKDSCEQGPVYFGVVAGSWTKRLGDRIPDRARVSIRTHHDAVGDKYAKLVVDSLGNRCQLFRSVVAGSTVP